MCFTAFKIYCSQEHTVQGFNCVTPLIDLRQFGMDNGAGVSRESKLLNGYECWIRSGFESMHSSGNEAKFARTHLKTVLLVNETLLRNIIDKSFRDIRRPSSVGQPKTLDDGQWKTHDYHQWILTLLLPTLVDITSRSAECKKFVRLIAFYIMGMLIMIYLS